MIDFSKLRILTAAERQRDDEQRIARQIEEDLKRRREWSRKSVTVTLSLEAEFRHTLSGGQCLHLRGAHASSKYHDSAIDRYFCFLLTARPLLGPQ
jgi:hypothetical protein